MEPMERGLTCRVLHPPDKVDFLGQLFALILAFCVPLISVDLRWCVPEAERRLWSDRVRDPDDGLIWSISGLAPNGALRLRRGAQTRDWTRWSNGPGSLS